MDVEKIVKSGKYDVHTIEDVTLTTGDRTDHIGLQVSARDEDDRYIKRFSMGFNPDHNFGQDVLAFLARNREADLSLDDLCSRLTGSKYVTLNIDKVKSGPKIEGIDYDEPTMWLELSPDFVREGLHDGVNGVNLDGQTELIEYSPTKPFSNFAEEKEFRRHYGRNRVWAWGGETYIYQIENDIRDVVSALNRLDFAYANGWSHSGTPKDHGGPGAEFVREDFTLNWFRNTSYVAAPDHAGYVIFRADEQNPDYQKFLADICRLQGVKINDTNDPEKNKILLVSVDNAIVKLGDVSAYQKHLEAKWNQILSVMQKYESSL